MSIVEGHHGDILLYPIDEVKGKKIEMKGKYNILAEGEITGHCHVIEKEKTILYMDSNNIMYVEVMEPVDLKHIDMKTGKKADHNNIKLQPNCYRVGIVKEYDPFEKELRNIQD